MGLINESRPSRNNDEHGIHTSTTAGGTFVPDASLLGYVPGTASGMTYKVCWVGGMLQLRHSIRHGQGGLRRGGCALRVSRWESSDYFRDSVAIGVFAAMESGILISRSSGNGGSGAPPLSNVAPWITTDGARTKPGGRQSRRRQVLSRRLTLQREVPRLHADDTAHLCRRRHECHPITLDSLMPDLISSPNPTPTTSSTEPDHIRRDKSRPDRVGGEHPCGLDGHGWPTELAVDTHWVKNIDVVPPREWARGAPQRGAPRVEPRRGPTCADDLRDKAGDKLIDVMTGKAA
ncbi:Subtilisin-like protease [Acorus calamus]|uniref:Subtilisin-like protease n=1 Tax=Acorus calamus TaxID=4465 RepID=A0AAV9DLZ8_ACOCL|nr:Subtilisin-like protease [Acorus calamus]